MLPNICTPHALHGSIQVAMGWGGTHPYQFCLRDKRLESSELSASLPDETLAALQLRSEARLTYEYGLNILWRHELRVEAHLPAEAVQRPTMRSALIKTEEQLDMQTLHRVRDRLVGCRTALINQTHAVLLERGPTFARGRALPAGREGPSVAF